MSKTGSDLLENNFLQAFETRMALRCACFIAAAWRKGQHRRIDLWGSSRVEASQRSG